MSPSSQRPWYLRVPNSFRPSVIPDPKEFGVVFFLVFHSSTYLYYIILRNCALCGMKDNQIRGNLPLITSRKICPITTICRLGHRDSCWETQLQLSTKILWLTTKMTCLWVVSTWVAMNKFLSWMLSPPSPKIYYFSRVHLKRFLRSHNLS